MKTLRTYQTAAVKALFNWLFSDNSGNPLVVAPVGSGKSLMIAEFIKQCHELYPRTRIVALTHVKELLEQTSKELRGQYPDCDFGFYCAGLGQKRLHNDVTFASIQSVYDKVASFNRVPEIIIIDECFTGDTVISTNNGEKRIDKMRLGDIVLNASGYGEVVAISKRKTKEIFRVKLNDGREIKCTGNHPFLSESGWTTARELEKGRKLFGIQDMPELWKTLSSIQNNCGETRKKRGVATGKKTVFQTKVLFDILLKEDGECHVDSRRKRKNAEKIKRDRAQAICSWWEWQRSNRTAKENDGDIGARLDSRASNKNNGRTQERDLSKLLQSGLRKQKNEISYRDRRRKSFWKKIDIRSKKGREIDVLRVESVEIEEQRGGEFVYNLQVSGHPSYFANGVLVHNCHLISHNDQTMYRKFFDSVLELNPNCKILGFTGTPFRADSGRLDEGEGKIFDGIAYEIEMKYMIDEGYWARPVTPKIDVKMDVSGVKTRGGDYIVGELEKKINTSDITDSCVRELLIYGHNRKKWMVFTAAVQHCTDVTNAIRAAGISCEMVTGDTPKDERARIIGMFRRGEIRCLVNVAVLTTGFDVPDVDLLAFMRPTRSPVLYIQTTGRGVRPVYAEGFDLSTRDGRLNAMAAGPKPDCLILDFGGIVDALGPIDQVSIRKKPKKKEDEETEKKAPVTKICPHCASVCLAAQRYCYNCSYCFIELSNLASEAAIISQDSEPQEFEVLTMHRQRWPGKNGKPDSMCVMYGTTSELIKEYVFFGHPEGSYPRQKSNAWFKKLCGSAPPPKSVEEALQWPYYQTPSKITARKEGKFWRVIDYDMTVKPKNDVIEIKEEYEIPF